MESEDFRISLIVQSLAGAVLMLCFLTVFGQNFAVIGDYGLDGENESKVANLVKGWNPDFIITTGDNNYPYGATETIDQNIGKYFSDYIYPYRGSYGVGAKENKFFPAIGNHDVIIDGQAYYDYFVLGGNEHYYDFIIGYIHFFSLNSNQSEPDGFDSLSIQANWLKKRLQNSTSVWKIVYFHHPPYSSGTHGDSEWMQWPFKPWGASVVLSGHDHVYERLVVNDLTYIVNGLGGNGTYYFIEEEQDKYDIKAQYNSDYGALKISGSAEKLDLEFHSVSDGIIDKFQITRKTERPVELFTSGVFLNLLIETDLMDLIQDRSDTARYYQATVSVEGGDPVKMELKVRGNFRRTEENCSFPPFWIRRAKNEDNDVYFDKHRKMKIVNPCVINNQYQQFIAQEYLAYKVFNILTDSSFRVQPISVKYKDINRSDTIRTFSILIEDAQSLGQRIGATEAKGDFFNAMIRNYHNTATMEFFQFMLGNDDWYFPDHNIQMFAAPNKDTLLVPYDFDFSRMVSAVYAHRSDKNTYRGFCHTEEEYELTIDNFNRKKQEILNLYTTTDLLNAESKDHSLRLIRSFYSIINDQERLKLEILDNCKDDY